MLISATSEIEGGRIAAKIGKIEATSTWHAAALENGVVQGREHALTALIRCAEDIDADAIIGVEYEVDSGLPMEEIGVTMQRVRATGIAVTLGAA